MLHNVVSSFTGEWVWLGLYEKRGREGRWKWTDETEFDYENWRPGDPDNGDGDEQEDCADFLYREGWDDFGCDNTHPFVCTL